MLTSLIRNARTLQRPDGCDLVLADGVVAQVLDAGTAPATADEVDVAGKVVLPSTVDAHVHLDKAYLMSYADVVGAVEPTLPAAIASVARLRTAVSDAAVASHARRALAALSRAGTTAARVQVEIDPDIGLDLLALHQELADEHRDRMHLQLVAFPQRGLRDGAMRSAVADAMRAGAHVVGGCPYVDDDPAAHLDSVFGLAETYGAAVDLHLDFGDDPSASLISLVAERTRAHAMAGHVTIGHVTTLAAMPAAQLDRTLDVLAHHDIALVALPVTDLFLAGHGDPGHGDPGRGDPGHRSVAPVERAVRRGVRVAIGNNNIGNPFAPFGDANLLRAAWVTGIIRRLSSWDERRILLAAVTSAPASILGLPPHGTAVGERADLVVLDTTDVSTAILEAPVALATLSAGDIVHTVSSPFREPASTP